MKLSMALVFILLIVNGAFADDTVKVNVGTQTFHCELGQALSCKAINQVQQKAIILKKTGGQVSVEDKPRGLTAEVVTSLNGTNVVYDMSVCSTQTCSLSTVTSDSSGKIDQVISGQYNMTQKSFDVIGFFISTQTPFQNFSEIIINQIGKIK